MKISLMRSITSLLLLLSVKHVFAMEVEMQVINRERVQPSHRQAETLLANLVMQADTVLTGGHIYYYGIGVSIDFVKARLCYKAVARQQANLEALAAA